MLLVLVFIYFVILRDTVVTVAGYMVNGVIVRGNTFLSAYTVYHCKKVEKCLLTVL